MNNMDMSKLMQILSNMDKKDLEKGLAKANEVLKNKSKEDILKDMQSGKNF